MDVPGFTRSLKQKNMDSEVWWDSSPTAFARFKSNMISKYPQLFEFIEALLPDNFAQSQVGISGATTNPRLVAQAVLESPHQWSDYLTSLPGRLTEAERARRLYDQVIVEGARQLHPLWIASRRTLGWLSAQIEGGEDMDERALVARGLQLARLAPNVMIKVPGSEQGYRAIEQLVAKGCSINNTFCFSVSQAAACLNAIHDGRLRAQLQGVSTERARYVISFMIGRLGAQEEFARQASQRRLCLTAADRRWAEILVYQAIQALLRRRPTPARLLLCSLKIDTDVQGREHCWHLQRTGADCTLYTLTPQIIEFLIRSQQQGRPVVPANGWVQVPKRVLNRLMAIPYFNQAYFEGDLAPADFASQPAFITASNDAREGTQRLSAFVQQTGDGAARPLIPPASDAPMEHWS